MNISSGAGAGKGETIVIRFGQQRAKWVLSAVVCLFGGWILTAVVWPLAGCGPHGPSTSINIDGSSTVYLVTEAAVEDYRTATKGSVDITIGISGTGGGFKKFC